MMKGPIDEAWAAARQAEGLRKVGDEAMEQAAACLVALCRAVDGINECLDNLDIRLLKASKQT